MLHIYIEVPIQWGRYGKAKVSVVKNHMNVESTFIPIGILDNLSLLSKYIKRKSQKHITDESEFTLSYHRSATFVDVKSALF